MSTANSLTYEHLAQQDFPVKQFPKQFEISQQVCKQFIFLFLNLGANIIYLLLKQTRHFLLIILLNSWARTLLRKVLKFNEKSSLNRNSLECERKAESRQKQKV
mgnify:CR=1 FL=1